VAAEFGAVGLEMLLQPGFVHVGPQLYLVECKVRQRVLQLGIDEFEQRFVVEVVAVALVVPIELVDSVALGLGVVVESALEVGYFAFTFGVAKHVQDQHPVLGLHHCVHLGVEDLLGCVELAVECDLGGGLRPVEGHGGAHHHEREHVVHVDFRTVFTLHKLEHVLLELLVLQHDALVFNPVADVALRVYPT